jgi:hypothetical protein
MKPPQPARIIASLMSTGLVVTQALAPAAFAQTGPVTNAEHANKGQKCASWEDLRQLKPGEKIQVIQKDLKSRTGSFVCFSDDSVSLKAPNGDKNVSRIGVLRVSRHGGKRLRKALIGAAAAGGAGAEIGAAAGECSNNS